MPVCPRAYLWNRWTDLYEILCAHLLWLWLGPPLAALRCVMYFRFYGWCHVWPYGETWRLHRTATATSGTAIPGRSLNVGCLRMLVAFCVICSLIGLLRAGSDKKCRYGALSFLFPPFFPLQFPPSHFLSSFYVPSLARNPLPKSSLGSEELCELFYLVWAEPG